MRCVYVPTACHLPWYNYHKIQVTNSWYTVAGGTYWCYHINRVKTELFRDVDTIYFYKVYYGGGCLTVHLGKAKLFGKRSQDPYAIVYLVDEATKKCYFQRDNRQTDVFDQNIEPNFNKTFYFKVNSQRENLNFEDAFP